MKSAGAEKRKRRANVSDSVLLLPFMELFPRKLTIRAVCEIIGASQSNLGKWKKRLDMLTAKGLLTKQREHTSGIGAPPEVYFIDKKNMPVLLDYCTEAGYKPFEEWRKEFKGEELDVAMSLMFPHLQPNILRLYNQEIKYTAERKHDIMKLLQNDFLFMVMDEYQKQIGRIDLTNLTESFPSDFRLFRILYLDWFMVYRQQIAPFPRTDTEKQTKQGRLKIAFEKARIGREKEAVQFVELGKKLFE